MAPKEIILNESKQLESIRFGNGEVVRADIAVKSIGYQSDPIVGVPFD